jgi:hypothetical protein
MFRLDGTALVLSLALLNSAVVAAQTPLKTLERLDIVPVCFAIRVGRWSPPLSDATYHAIPREIVLDTARVRGGSFRLAPNIQFPYGGSIEPRWHMAGGTIRLTWSNGFAVTEVWLTGTADSVSGSAQAQNDVSIGGRESPRAAVTARRVKCSAALQSEQR